MNYISKLSKRRLNRNKTRTQRTLKKKRMRYCVNLHESNHSCISCIMPFGHCYDEYSLNY